MNKNLHAPRLSQEESEQATDEILLRVWSGLEANYLDPAKNAQETFSVYSRYMGCSFEETMTRAAKALLAEWREGAQ